MYKIIKTIVATCIVSQATFAIAANPHYAGYLNGVMISNDNQETPVSFSRMFSRNSYYFYYFNGSMEFKDVGSMNMSVSYGDDECFVGANYLPRFDKTYHFTSSNCSLENGVFKAKYTLIDQNGTLVSEGNMILDR